MPATTLTLTTCLHIHFRTHTRLDIHILIRIYVHIHVHIHIPPLICLRMFADPRTRTCTRTQVPRAETWAQAEIQGAGPWVRLLLRRWA